MTKQQIVRALLKFYLVKKAFVGLYNTFRKNPSHTSVAGEFARLDAGKIVAEVTEKGFSSVFDLSQGLLEPLALDCSTRFCVPDGSPQMQFKIDPKDPKNPDEKFIRYIYPDAHNWPSVRSIVHNATVLDIARGYLGNEPIIQNVAIWWSFPKLEGQETNLYNFHYDIDNLKFIKLFTYLTDVDAENGPHVIYPNTHKYKSLLQKRYRSVPDNRVNEVLGHKPPVVMVGKKGTSFFEDTFSYHKGQNPVRPRLIFQVEYSLTSNKLG